MLDFGFTIQFVILSRIQDDSLHLLTYGKHLHDLIISLRGEVEPVILDQLPHNLLKFLYRAMIFI